jgi:hypothetical protein
LSLNLVRKIYSKVYADNNDVCNWSYILSEVVDLVLWVRYALKLINDLTANLFIPTQCSIHLFWPYFLAWISWTFNTANTFIFNICYFLVACWSLSFQWIVHPNTFIILPLSEWLGGLSVHFFLNDTGTLGPSGFNQ